MATIWIIGRKVELPNGHKYMAEPFIAFGSNEAAQEACDMIERVSGERPIITSAPINDFSATAVSNGERGADNGELT